MVFYFLTVAMEVGVRSGFLFVIIICLFLSGCGRESSGEESPAAFSVVLKEMEPLQFREPENENLADMLQKSGSSMMAQIGAGSRLGSGVIYGTEDEWLLILTAGHVLEEAGASLRVTFSDGLSVSCTDFTSYEIGDIGIIRVDGSEIPEENLKAYLRVCVDKESFDGIEAGDGCIVMGSRTGVAAEAFEGIVLEPWVYMEDYDQYMMWVKAEGKPGMSGGGLFDRQGHFLGIVSGGSGDGELAVVPLSLIRAALGE